MFIKCVLSLGWLFKVNYLIKLRLRIRINKERKRLTSQPKSKDFFFTGRWIPAGIQSQHRCWNLCCPPASQQLSLPLWAEPLTVWGHQLTSFSLAWSCKVFFCSWSLKSQSFSVPVPSGSTSFWEGFGLLTGKAWSKKAARFSVTVRPTPLWKSPVFEKTSRDEAKGGEGKRESLPLAGLHGMEFSDF